MRRLFIFELTLFLFFFKIFIYLFLERGAGREKERKRSINVWLPLACSLLGIWPKTQAYALTENPTGGFSLVPTPALNSESHQPGHFTFLICTLIKLCSICFPQHCFRCIPQIGMLYFHFLSVSIEKFSLAHRLFRIV